MDSNYVIDAIGGTAQVARLCEVTDGAVSQWRSEGIPKARLMYLKAVRPDVFEIAPSTHPSPQPQEQEAA